MRKYAWAIGFVLMFFGALQGIQSSIKKIESHLMSGNSLALIIGVLIVLGLLIQDSKALRKKRAQELHQIQETLKSLDTGLTIESEARRHADEEQLTVRINKLAERISKLEDFKKSPESPS
jgi:cell division protein FtsB